MESDVFGILVFGGTASGKTSMLAAMCEATRLHLRPRGFSIDPDLDDEFPLSVARGNLEDLFLEEKSPYWRAVESTSMPQDLRFYFREVVKAGAAPPEEILTLHFLDTPGDFAEGRLSSLVKELQQGPRCGILAVDCVEMLRGVGQVSRTLRRNQPDVVARAVEEWVAASSGEPLLLVVALTKSETWVRDRPEADPAAGAAELLTAFREQYSKLLGFLEQHSDRIVVATCPVQTVGNLVFHQYLRPEVDGKYPGEEFSRIRGTTTGAQRSTGYSPLHCDVPLRYVLNFALLQRIEASFSRADQEVEDAVADLPWWAGFLIGERARKWLKSLNRALEGTWGDTAPLIRVLSGFVREFPGEPGFEVLQGRPLIDRSYQLWGAVWQALRAEP